MQHPKVLRGCSLGGRFTRFRKYVLGSGGRRCFELKGPLVSLLTEPVKFNSEAAKLRLYRQLNALGIVDVGIPAILGMRLRPSACRRCVPAMY